MSPFPIKNPKPQTSGTALVIVLTFLIILSGMVIAFMEFSKWDLQTAQASARNLQAQEIALGGADAITSLLLTEIDDAANSDRDTVNNVTLYRPKADAHLFPERVVASGAFAFLPSLIKSSRHGVAPYAAAASSTRSASQAPTANVSANGRALDFDFWNTPRLNFSSADAKSTFESTAAPDWILITKENGPKAFTTWNNDLKDSGKPDFVIGRYAYTVYDVSGLLDISVAGRPAVSQTATGLADQAVLDAKSKPALAFADLSEIPGITDPTTFINWRNAASAASATIFHNYVFSDDWTVRDFSKVKNGDNTVFSRSDLIKAVTSGACGITTDALPYLTTFSRMKNAPSWSPTIDESSPYRYKTEANNSSSTNRNLAWVRVKNEFIRRDGATAKVGEPLIKNRFPLSRFGLITTGATTPESATDIRSYFGLIRSTTGGPWTYNHGAADRILTLDEVADANREPDLPELLQATILNGSLASGDPGRSNSEIEYEKTQQILFILAHMIDQQDADNYPTLIRFNAGGEIWEVAGRESLPYLNKLVVAWGKSNESPPPGNDATATYLFPQLTRGSNMLVQPSTADLPSLRIRVIGQISQEFEKSGGGSITSNPPLDINAVAVFGPNGWPFFGLNGLSGTSLPGLPHDYQMGFTPGQFRASISRFIGIRLADLTRPSGSGGTARLKIGTGSPPKPFNFIMDFLGADSLWHPYNRLIGSSRYTPSGTEILSDGVSGDTIAWDVPVLGNVDINDVTWPASPISQALVRSDECALPGISAVWCGNAASPLMLNGPNPSIQYAMGSIRLSNGTMLTSTSPPPGASGLPGGFAPADLSINLTASSHYADLDGVVRKADGWRGGDIIPPVPRPPPPINSSLITGYHYNRPFRSPGEIGAVSRGQPWRTLNFWTADTADAGLLDIFTTRDQAVAAGVNPNTKLAPVLQAVMKGATANLFGFGEKITYASPLVNMTAAITAHTSSEPFANRAELSETAGMPFMLTQSNSKETTEQAVRALSEISNTRTWNLLIDVVGQAGRYVPSADSLDKFQVQGQSRYWVHLAIDRYTGEIVDKRIEPAAE